MFCLDVYLYTACVPGACGGRERVSDPGPPKLELELFVNHHADAGNRTRSSGRAALCSEPLSHVSSPSLFCFGLKLFLFLLEGRANAAARCGGQRATCGNWFSPSPVPVLERAKSGRQA